MKILVLHSLVLPGAPPEEEDTLIAADAVAKALETKGHQAPKAAYHGERLPALIAREKPDMVFNLVEGVDGKGILAPEAPRLLAELGVPFTGADEKSMAITCDKPLTKSILRKAGLPTPDWSCPPDWLGLDGRRWIVKAALEDGSIGLDDGCIVTGPDVKSRAAASALRFGGRWFAEEYVEGREFNIALLGNRQNLRIFPMAEMTFADWPRERPRIVGYGAKWEEDSFASRQTVRRFGVEKTEPVLARRLSRACEESWALFALTGFVRVDFRVGEGGEPQILEINVNPCITPDAGFAAAAEEAGMSYEKLITEIVRVAQ